MADKIVRASRDGLLTLDKLLVFNQEILRAQQLPQWQR